MTEAAWIEATLKRAGRLVRSRPGALPLHGARQDSRGLRPGELFLALSGERSDGHRYLDPALAAGAAGALFSEPSRFDALAAGFPEVSLFLVDDVLSALQLLAAERLRSIRSRTGAEVVAVTGSNGKTATKDLCAALLATRGVVHASEGNYNNLIGLPMTLLAAPSETRFFVLEMGCSSFGEIARLCELFPPRVGIITNIGSAHLEELGDRDGVARAKGELAEALPADGLLVLNGEDPYAGRLAARCRGRIRRFGRGGGMDLLLEDLGPPAGTLGARRLRVDGRELTLPSPWPHAQHALGAAWLAAAELGAEPAAMAAAAAGGFRERNRGGVFTLGTWTLVDDSYNANPESTLAGLRWLATSTPPGGGRRWALLGDMLELGEAGGELHRAIGEEAARLGLDGLLACGPLCEELVAGARAGGLSAEHFPDAAALAAALPGRLADGDLILVKGSRGMAMETVIAALETAAGVARELRS